MPKGNAEIWELVNPDNGWQHPIHIQFEEGRILSKTTNGVNVTIPPNERIVNSILHVDRKPSSG